jgi:glycosyltransferase involved in cell wall biosynthesis
MENIPSREEVFRKESGKVCKLLFMGVYWDNKGGDIAYNCLLELLKLGVDAELSICGCIPPENYQHEKMNVIPFIDKNSEEGRKKLQSIFSSHDFLILPTRFDCTPIVICEASAFGMPSLVANTGGVAGHLKEDINGFLIDYKDTGEGYAKKIKEIFEDKDRFNSLRQTSRKLYEEELNWEKYGEELEKILLRI